MQPPLSHPTVQPASPGDSRDHWADWQKPQEDAAVFIFLHEQALLSISHDFVNKVNIIWCFPRVWVWHTRTEKAHAAK